MLSIPQAHAPRRVSREGDETVHFRPHRRRYNPPGVLMTLSRFAPMIDMSFLLLVFFMTTTRFSAPEGMLSSQMPAYGAGGSGPVVALPLTPLVLRVHFVPENELGYSISIDRLENTPKDPRALPQFLAGILGEVGFEKDTPLILVADNDVQWDHVVQVWNYALRAGWTNVAFAAQ